MKFTFNCIVVLFALTLVMQSCKEEEGKDPIGLDTEIFQEYKEANLTAFMNGDFLEGKGPSPHGSFALSFNDVAQGALDSAGVLPIGKTFPKGSMIVKEIGTVDNINLIAIMKKESSNENAGEGWIWGEYKTDGSVFYSVSNKGAGCTGCHGGTPNRDFTRTFDLH